MAKKILITDPIHPKAIKMLEDEGFEISLEKELTTEKLAEKIGDYDALIVRSRTKVTKQIIEAGKNNLKVIGRAGVGLDNIDLRSAEQNNIRVVRSPKGSSVSVAELIMGLILSLLRSIPKGDYGLKEGKWIKKQIKGKELRGKTIGIIGCGNVGIELAKRAKAFEMNVLGCDILESALENAGKVGCSCVEFEEVVRNSDILSICCPLNNGTRNMINRDIINLMKPTAYLINTARGDIVDEQALYEALRDEKIAGAALDVFLNEPNPNPDLVKLPNVIATPHIGAQTTEAIEAVSTILAEKIIKILKGEKLDNE
ncbi:MAG: hydroxyacid dehydrogenase [Candidatus Helarchaeota archaeon]